MTINEKYIELLLPHFAAAVKGGEVVRKPNGVINFPCPFCSQYRKNDSKKNDLGDDHANNRKLCEVDPQLPSTVIGRGVDVNELIAK